MTIHPSDLSTGLNWTGLILTITLALSSVRIFRDILFARSTTGYKVEPYVVELLSSIIWLYCRFLNVDAFAITSNAFGCMVLTSYLYIYIICPPRNNQIFARRCVVICLACATGLIIITFILCPFYFLSGVMELEADVITLLTFGGTIRSTYQVYKDRSGIRHMPFFMACVLTVNGLFSAIGAILEFKPYMTLAYGIGTIVAAIQIIVYLVVCFKTNIHRTPPAQTTPIAPIILPTIPTDQHAILTITTPDTTVTSTHHVIPTMMV